MRKVLLLATLTLVAACDQPKDRTGKAAPPAPPAASAPAPTPAWAAGLQGQPLVSAFSTTNACMGYVDGPQARSAQGVTVIGWSWMKDLKTGAPQIVLTDPAGKMVAFGSGGGDRADVPANVPEITRPDVGWSVVAPGSGVFGVYGVDPESKTACRLGEARL